MNDPVKLWAISAAVKKLACVGLILIEYWNEGTVVAPVKLKEIRNQYWLSAMYYCVVVIVAKVLVTLTVNKLLQIVQPAERIAVGIRFKATP